MEYVLGLMNALGATDVESVGPVTDGDVSGSVEDGSMHGSREPRARVREGDRVERGIGRVSLERPPARSVAVWTPRTTSASS